MCADVNADIIIIGGGISGMVSAYSILKHEPTLKVIVLEAKDRIGGRTLTVPIEMKEGHSCPVDLGGHWVSSEQKLLLKLLDDLKLQIMPQYKTGIAIADIGCNKIYPYQDHPIIGNIFCKFELTRFFTKLEYMSGEYTFPIKQNRNKEKIFLDSISMEEFIKKNIFTNAARNIARNLIRTTCGIDPSLISVLCYMVFCNGSLGFTNLYMSTGGGAREFWIQEGAQEICNRIANKLGKDVVIKNSPVLKIKHSDKEVKVTTQTTVYTCSYIIVAIPPREILKINFEPFLSKELYDVLINSQTEHLIKFVISYQENFWRVQGYSGEIFSCGEGPIRVCYDSSKNNIPLLMGYVYQKNSNEICKDAVIKQLVKYWGEKASTPLNYVEKNWVSEEYNGSCPTSRPILNCMKYCHKLSEPLGRIYWAGTETANIWNGYMEGAVQAGHRASLELLYQLRPQSLSFSDMIYNEYYRYKKVHRTRLVEKWYLYLDHPFFISLVMGATIFGLYALYNRCI